MQKFLYLIFLFLFFVEIHSQPLKIVRPIAKETPKFEITFDYRMSNASVYYDSTGKSQSRLQDTVPIYRNDTLWGYKQYTFQLVRYFFVPGLKWQPNDKFNISANLVLAYSTYEEKYTYDTNYRQYYRADFNKFQAESFNLDAEYFLQTGRTNLSVLGGISTPFGFHRGQNDPKYDFLCDGAFEFNLGAKFRQIFKSSNFELASIYNWRDEDLKPRFIFSSQLGFTSVPGTEISVKGRYFLPIGNNDRLPPFDVRRRPLNEEAVQIGANFRILFENNIFLHAGYMIYAAGKNTLGTGTFNLLVGYRF